MEPNDSDASRYIISGRILAVILLFVFFLKNQDGIGNSVAAMIYGPHKVILMVGMNKAVKSVEDAVSRIKNIAAPMDAIRFGKDTPC